MKKLNDKEVELIYRKIIGKHIRRNREALGIILEEAAGRIGCSSKHLGRLERGEKTPKGHTLAKIQLALDFKSDDYLHEFEQAIKEYEKDE